MPAAKNQVARGPQTPEFNYRTGGGFGWAGMVPDGDPASIAKNRLRFTGNVNYRNGNVEARGGQARLNSSELQASDAVVNGLTDFQLGTRRSLYVVGDGCPAISGGTGFYIGWLDQEIEPPFQPGVYYDFATLNVDIGTFDGDLYAAVDTKLRRIVIIEQPYAAAGGALSVSGSGQDIALVTLPSPFTTFRGLQAFDGRLFAGADAGAGASKVAAWDGVTLRDDLLAIDPPKGFGLYRESLILGFNGTPNAIRVRAPGASPGTWATVAPDFGTAVFRDGISYKDRFYFTTDGEDLYRFDGTNLNRLPIGTTGLPAGCVTYGITVFDGYLFVAYKDGASGKLLRFDGTTWVANHKNMTAQFAGCTALRPLRTYRGTLVAGGLDSASSGGGTLYQSPGTATNGTWTQIIPAALNNGDIDHMLVY